MRDELLRNPDGNAHPPGGDRAIGHNRSPGRPIDRIIGGLGGGVEGELPDREERCSFSSWRSRNRE